MISLSVCSELIEAHAVDTYAEFAESNKALLMTMPAPKVAKQYYEAEDMYIFDEFQTARSKGSRRPKVLTLYDVFRNICEDEGEHVATMAACQDPDVLVRSPNTEAAIFASASVAAVIAAYLSGSGAVEGGLPLDFIRGLDMDSLLEGILGGAALSETVAESVEAAPLEAEGVLVELFKVLNAIKFLFP